MASILKVNTLTGASTAGSIAVTGEGNSTTTNLQQGLLKNWIHFDGTAGTPTAADSFNHSSITDAGTGDYENNITNAMANVNYMSICGSGQFHSVDGGHNSTSKYSLELYNSSHSAADTGRCNMGLAGDLA